MELYFDNVNTETKGSYMLKKNIVVITCQGGSCHTAVCQALSDYISPDYNLIFKDLFKDIFHKHDISRILSFNKFNSTDIYDSLIYKNKLKSTMPALISITFKLLQIASSPIEKIIIEHIRPLKPDLIISVIPIFNGIFERVAQTLDIPFLLIPLDLDITQVFLNDMGNTNYEKSYCILPFDDIYLGHKNRNKLPFPSHHISITGFPIRKQFFAQFNKNETKERYHLPNDKPIITVLMGGAGSEMTLQIYKELCTINTPLHAIICLGKNTKLRDIIEKTSPPPQLTYSLFNYTNDIASLIAVADVFITKPGPGSICEALYTNTPMILENSAGVLYWERFHIKFVQEHGFGEILDNIHDLPTLLDKFLTDKNYHSNIVHNLESFQKLKFGDHINSIIESILEKHSDYSTAEQKYTNNQKNKP